MLSRPRHLVSAAAMVVPIWGVPLSRSDFAKPVNLLSHRVIGDLIGRINLNGYRMDFRDPSFSSFVLGNERELLWNQKLL